MGFCGCSRLGLLDPLRRAAASERRLCQRWGHRQPRREPSTATPDVDACSTHCSSSNGRMTNRRAGVSDRNYPEFWGEKRPSAVLDGPFGDRPTLVLSMAVGFCAVAATNFPRVAMFLLAGGRDPPGPGAGTEGLGDRARGRRTAGVRASRRVLHAFPSGGAAARLVLLAADGHSNAEVVRRFGMSARSVGRWRRRFHELRLPEVDDETRSGRRAAFPPQ